MKILTALMLTAFLSKAGAESFLGPEIGDVAPPLKIKKWLQTPFKTTNGWPAGKVVVVEFWATWCFPCVEAFPHLNELADRFKDKPVQFIAVTDETEGTIQPFLKKTPIHAWIGLMADGMFGDADPYRIFAVPHTVIIDAKGRVAAVTDPRRLDPELIEQCLAGIPQGATAAERAQNGSSLVTEVLDHCPAVGVVPGQSSIGRTPVYQVLIRPEIPVHWANGQPEIQRWSSSPFGLSLPYGTLKQALLEVFGLDSTPSRLVLKTKLPKERYDFYVSLPLRDIEALANDKRLEKVFAQAVQLTFGLNVKRETQAVETLVLRATPASAGKLAASSNEGKQELFAWNELTGVNRTLTQLANGLESASGQPVLDETGLTNQYSFHIKWDERMRQHRNPSGMAAAVRKLGLDLTLEKRNLEMVVVSDDHGGMNAP